MKKYLLAAALVLVPSFAFASTPNDTVRATLVQQLLAEFVSDVNAIQQMQDTIKTAVDPTQFSSLSTLLQNQFADTTTQLDNLLNPSGISQTPSSTQPQVNNSISNTPSYGSVTQTPMPQDLSGITVVLASQSTLRDPIDSEPYGAYGFIASVLDSSGNSVRNAAVVMSDGVQASKTATSTTNALDGKLMGWIANFEYVPLSLGTKTITFTSGNLSQSYTLDVQ